MRDARAVAGAEPIASTRWARLRDRILHRHTAPGRLAVAVGLGVFIGVTPFYGLHTLLALGAAWLLRLNIAALVIATQIGNPVFAAVLIPASAWIGQFVGAPPDPDAGAWYDPTRAGFYGAWLKGCLVLGIALGSICGALTWGAAAILARRRHA